MAYVAVPDARPFRGEAFFGFSKEDAVTTLELLSRAAAYPGRVRRLPLSLPPPNTFRPEEARSELTFVADPLAIHSVALTNLESPTLRIVLYPAEDNRFVKAMRAIIEGAWDFSYTLPLLDPVPMPKMATFTVTFL